MLLHEETQHLSGFGGDDAKVIPCDVKHRVWVCVVGCVEHFLEIRQCRGSVVVVFKLMPNSGDDPV